MNKEIFFFAKVKQEEKKIIDIRDFCCYIGSSRE